MRIFLSYASQDREQAKSVYLALPDHHYFSPSASSQWRRLFSDLATNSLKLPRTASDDPTSVNELKSF